MSIKKKNKIKNSVLLQNHVTIGQVLVINCRDFKIRQQNISEKLKARKPSVLVRTGAKIVGFKCSFDVCHCKCIYVISFIQFICKIHFYHTV